MSRPFDSTPFDPEVFDCDFSPTRLSGSYERRNNRYRLARPAGVNPSSGGKK
jgi:hypothetical protein